MTIKLIKAYLDFNKPFKLYINISDISLKVVLAQNNEKGKKRVIVYEARRLNIAEKNYLMTKKKYLAVVWTI